MSSSTRAQAKRLGSSPDEVRTFEKGRIEIVNFDNGVTIGKGTLQPGWCVKPIVKTNSCQVPHTSYIMSGRMRVVMDDGTELEGGHGDTAIISPGHNAWVVGDDPCVMIDFTGAKEYAKVS
jgi:hypothetical protein